MNSKTTNIILGVILLILIIPFFQGNNEPIQFQGNGGRQFSGLGTINSSATVTSQGITIITNASNTGQWFSIRNTSSSPVWCGGGTNTSTLVFGGQLLVGITSSTGSNVWEMWEMGGPISCWVSGVSGTISYSFTSQQ